MRFLTVLPVSIVIFRSELRTIRLGPLVPVTRLLKKNLTLRLPPINILVSVKVRIVVGSVRKLRGLIRAGTRGTILV